MHVELIAILRCPDDGTSGLRLRTDEVDAEGEIVSGSLGCATCGTEFPIASGIVSMLPSEMRADPRDTTGKEMRSEMEARDAEATPYDERYDNRAHRFEIETCVARIQVASAERVLDVGCGTGRVTRAYLPRAGSVVGVDLSLDSLKHVRGRLAPELKSRLDLVQCEVGHLPFADAHFDVAVSTSVFSNVPTEASRQAGLAEVGRVLADDGRFLLTVYNHCWTKRVRHRLGLARSGRKEGYQSDGRIHYYNFDPDELRGFMSGAFTPGPCFGLNHKVPVLSNLSQGIAERIDRFLFRVPFSLAVVAKEVGVVGRKKPLGRTIHEGTS